VSENVFNILQMGPQSGTFDAPGSAVAATVLIPISDKISPDLTLGGAYPALDRGRNVRTMGGSGYKGVRSAAVTVPSEVRFEDIWKWLELAYGHVSATGTNPYTRLYAFETGAPTVIPATFELGNIDAAAAQERMPSCLIDQLTMGFSAITAGQASPWTLSAQLLGFDLEPSALTGSLAAAASVLETVQGHLTRFYEGVVSTAFGSLGELGGLRSFTMTANRNLRLRAYGGTTDMATKFGYGDMSTATYEAVVAVSTSAKTDLHDVWRTSGGSLGERRMRWAAAGSGSKAFTIDARAGMFAIPWDDSDGERVYKISGEFADDTTLDASHTVTVVNTVP
jgi:hypothetical protein